MTDKSLALRTEPRRVALVEASARAAAPGGDLGPGKLRCAFGCARSLTGDVLGRLAALLEPRRRRRSALRAARDLLELDSRLLRDIGLRRSDILAAVHSQPRKKFPVGDAVEQREWVPREI